MIEDNLSFLDFAANIITNEGLRIEKCHLQYDPLDDGYIAFNESLFNDKTRRYLLVGCIRWIGLFTTANIRQACRIYKQYNAYQMFLNADEDVMWIIDKDDCMAFIEKHFVNEQYFEKLNGRLNARIAVTLTDDKEECTGGSGQNRQGDQIPRGKETNALQKESQ